MLNQCNFIDLYVNKEMSLAEVSKLCGIPVSSLRAKLLSEGVLRSPMEAQTLASKKGKKGAHLIGKKRIVKDETREKMKIGRKKWADKNATGLSLKPNGYFEITMGENKFKSQHRVLMEEYLGRKLSRHEHVHHIDGDRGNNSIGNLSVMTISEHVSLHARRRNEQRDNLGRFKQW